MPKLSSARYGKENVRVYKVHRDEETGVQTVVEMTGADLNYLLNQGWILIADGHTSSYTEADNSVVVATESIKNTVYILAKQHPVNPPELFASVLAAHFIDTYQHIHVAHVKVVVHPWSRMLIDGNPHPHSFIRDGTETRNAEALAKEGSDMAITSAIAGLLILKSTGSEFHGFVRDEYTTLPDIYDRILSTEVDCGWTWKPFAGVNDVQSSASKFDEAWERARSITLRVFAQTNSASVQNTMYKMCENILAAIPDVDAVEYSLPNRHYWELDLSWHNGLKNTGKDAEVYVPQSNPNGLIQCKVTRDSKSKPVAPKRGLSAYMFFANENREKLRTENPGITFGNIGKVLGERWVALPETQRARYEAMAAADKRRYEDEKAAYQLVKNKPRRSQVSDYPF